MVKILDLSEVIKILKTKIFKTFIRHSRKKNRDLALESEDAQASSPRRLLLSGRDVCHRPGQEAARSFGPGGGGELDDDDDYDQNNDDDDLDHYGPGPDEDDDDDDEDGECDDEEDGCDDEEDGRRASSCPFASRGHSNHYGWMDSVRPDSGRHRWHAYACLSLPQVLPEMEGGPKP